MILISLMFQLVMFESAHANDCKDGLLDILGRARQTVQRSHVTPECKSLAFYGGQPGCLASGGSRALRSILAPFLRAANTHCGGHYCSSNKQQCLDFVASDRRLVALGIEGIISDINSEAW